MTKLLKISATLIVLLAMVGCSDRDEDYYVEAQWNKKSQSVCYVVMKNTPARADFSVKVYGFRWQAESTCKKLNWEDKTNDNN